MRFRLCGGSDCPDWLLAEIAALSAVSVLRVRQLSVQVTVVTVSLPLRRHPCPLQACESLCSARPLTSSRLAELATETKLGRKEVVESSLLYRSDLCHSY